MNAFEPNTKKAEAVHLCEFEASLVYIASSRRARTTQRNPISKNKQTKMPKQQQNPKQRKGPDTHNCRT